MHIAGKAASKRAAQAPGDTDIVSPLQMTKLAVGIGTDNKNIFLHLETKEKFAIDMAMNVDLATKLVSSLQHALDELPRTSQRKSLICTLGTIMIVPSKVSIAKAVETL